MTRELLPDPETPVTTVMIPSGISTSISLRLLTRAPRTLIHPEGFLRSEGTGMNLVPLRYWPVIESGLAMISSAVPCATTRPPWEPAPGPMSTI